MNKLKAKDIDVLILCGGLGRRLRRILNNLPKPMAEINGRPFLDILIGYVRGFGFRRFILCAGYNADTIRRYYQQKKTPFEIIICVEKELQGTAGAVRNAAPFIQSPSFLVMNGDSICRMDLGRFIAFHFKKDALISIALTDIKGKKDYGNVSLSKSAKLMAFQEKPAKKKGELVSAGIYLFQKEALALIPKNKQVSLEKDFFPKLISKRAYGYVTDAALIDIGTPKRLRKAQKIL